MSYTSQSKGDRNKAKFQASNINNVFKGKSTETQQKVPHRQYGMQVLGRVSNVRRMPRPSVLPSLKAETGGNDPRVNLVPPGGQGWGGSAESGGMLVRNSRAEALLDSPPHSQSTSATGGSSAQGGRAGASQSVASSGAEARSWSRVTGGNAAGVGGPGGGGGGGSGSSGGTSTGAGNSSGGGHNGWASASGGSQALSTASQRDFPKLGASTVATSANSSDTSLRPQGSLSGNWRDRGRNGGVTVAAPAQQSAPLSPTSAAESADVSGGGAAIASQGGPVSGGSRTNVTSTNSRLPSHLSFSGSTVGGNPRTFAETGSNARFDGTGAAPSSGAANRVPGKMPPQTRTSAPLRTTLDDKAASTAPTGWAADQGELDFSEQIVFSDEEDDSPVPSKPKQMVGDDKVIGSNTNGDHGRQILNVSQVSPELQLRSDPSLTVRSHGVSNNEVQKIPPHRTGGQVGEEPNISRKSDEPDSIGIGVSQRSVMGLMQIPGPTPPSHHITLSHPHQQHGNFAVGAVREAWPSGPTTNPNVSIPQQPHQHQLPPPQSQSQHQHSQQAQQSQHPQAPQPQQQQSQPQTQQQQPQPHHHHHHQQQPQQQHGATHYPPLLFTSSRVSQGPYGPPTATSLHPTTHPFNSNPGPLMSAPVPNPSQLFAATNEDKHISDQRNLLQKEFKNCVERARMKKRTDESDVRGGGATPSSVEDDRENQRQRPRQRFDAPSTSSKGSMSDIANVDDCESRSLAAAPREETGPPGGPPMPPVPIVAPPPPAHTHSYPVHGIPTHFGAMTQAAAAHFGPRAPWHGAHPPGATAAPYPHPAAQHPTFPHPYPPPTSLPTYLLDPNIRPKTTQEYSALMEKFQEFLMNESKRSDKNGKAEGDRTGQLMRQAAESGSKKVVEQVDPFAEDDSHENRESSSALASGDVSSNQQTKLSKRESHIETNNLAQSNASKRSQSQISRDELSHEHHPGTRRIGDLHQSSSDRDGQASRGGPVGRSETWEERDHWSSKARDTDNLDTNFGDTCITQEAVDDEVDTDDQSSDRKRMGSRDIRLHPGIQKKNRNAGDYALDQQGKRSKTTRGHRGSSGGTKMRGRGASASSNYQTGHFGSEEELTRPPRGGSAGQLSRSSSSLAERSEWPMDEMTISTGDNSHRQHYSQQIPQQHTKKGSGGPRRGSSSSRGMNPGLVQRTRDYSSQPYATWGGSTSGTSRSYNSYRMNARNYNTGGNRRYGMDHYSQSQYYDDYSYGYDYSMDDFGGQWQQSQPSERSKQSQQQGRRDAKKPARERITQNRSSAPPAGANERSDSAHQQPQTSDQQQAPAQPLPTQTLPQHAQNENQNKQGRRDQQNRNREQSVGNKNVTGQNSKGRAANKKQGSTESNASSGVGDANITSIVASNTARQMAEPKSDDDKSKVEEKAVIQLQPAPAPTVNVWNTKHPLIANTPGSPAPANQSNEGSTVPVDLMATTIPIASEIRTQSSNQSPVTPKPLLPLKCESAGDGEDGNSASEAAPAGASESRRGRESSKSRRDRGGKERRQSRGERRGSSRRGGAGASAGSSSGGNAGQGMLASGGVPDSAETKHRDHHTQMSQNEDMHQRARRRRPNKENMEDDQMMSSSQYDNMWFQVYADDEYGDYDYNMSRSYMGGRFNMARSVRGTRGYRGYHYRSYGNARAYYQYYPGGRSYYPSNQRYFGNQQRYRGSGTRAGSSSGNYEGDTGAYGSSGGGSKRQGSVSKETVTSDGNEQEDWETASESSDVANRDTRRRPPSGGSGGGGGGAAGGGGSGGSNATTGGSTSSSGNTVNHQQPQQSQQQRQRGRQQKSGSGGVSSMSDEKLCDEDSGSSTPQQTQRKRNRMDGIDLNNFASVVAVDNLPEVTVDEEFLYDNAAEFVEVLSKNARKTKKREEMKQKQEQEQMTQRDPRSRQAGGRRNGGGGSSSDSLTKRRNTNIHGSAGSGSGSGSPPKRLQSSKMTADERRRQKKATASIVKPSGMVKPLLSSLSDQSVPASGASSSNVTSVQTSYIASNNSSVGGTGRSNKTKLPPRLAKQQQQQQQQHVNTTTNAPPLMSLDSAELEQSILAADLSAGRKCQAVSSASVTDFKIESWDNSLAEDIPKVRRNADQQLLAKAKAQSSGTDSPKSSVLAPIAPPSSTSNGITSTGKADSGVDTGGEVSDRSSHSSGGATATDNRTHSPQTTSDSTVTGQSISTSLLEASVTSTLQTGDAVVDSSNEEYKLPDGFVLSCQRVTGDYDEMKTSASAVGSSGSAGRGRNNTSKMSETCQPVHEVVDSSKASEVGACALADTSASVSAAVSKGTSDESMPMSAASVTVTTGSGQSSTVEEGTSTLNKKIALVKSCWPEANDKTSSSVADTETGSLLSTGTAATSSTSVIETETAVSSAVVISNVCKVKPQQKLTDPTSSASSVAAVDEVNSSSVSVTTSSVPDVHDAPTMPVFPGVPHMSTLPSSAPSFVPKAALFQQANPQDSILTASGNAGVMFASSGFQHLPGASQQPRGGYGPPGGAGAFGAPPQPTNVGRPNLPFSSGNGGKCPPVSLSIPMAQQNAAAKALGLGLGFGMGGNSGGDPSLLGHGAGTSNNAAVAALLQRQNSNSVGVIGPPTGPSTPQGSTYQPYNIQGSIMSNAAAAAPSAPPTPTGGSWPNPYGPNLSFTPGLHNPTPGTQQAAAWTFLKNQNPSGPTGPAAPGLPSPNTPSPAPSRQPLFFNLWPIASSNQTQQPAGSASQQANLGTTGNPLFGTNSGSSANKFPGTNPPHSSQLGAMPPPPNLHNLVSLPQFRGGLVDNNTNCNVQSSVYDTNPFPHQHQPAHQQQQPSFPPFPDFTSFSQPHIPLKPPSVVAHSNTAAAVPTAPSPQQMDILTLLTNEFNSNRGTESKTSTLSSLCMTPFSQPTQPRQQQPQHSTAVSRHTVTGLNTNMGIPHGLPGLHPAKQNTMDLTTGMNAKPPSGWGPAGVMPVSSASHIPSHVSQSVHHSRSLGGSIAPPRSSPSVAGVCGSAVQSNSQNTMNNRRVVSNNSITHSTAPGVQPVCANQQYSGQNYKSYGGSNYSNRGGSVGYGGHRGSRGARGSGGHASRGAVYGGSYRNRASNSAAGMKPNQSRSNNYGSRTNTSHPDVSSRRIPAAQNLQSHEEESDMRTVEKSVITNTPSTTVSTCVPSHSSNEGKPTGNAETITVTLSGCGDNSLSEPMDSKPNDSSGDIELDSTNRSAISLSPSPSDIIKNGQQVDSAVLLLDGPSEKFETVTLPSSVIQSNESSSAVLSVTPSTGVVDF